MSDIDMHKEVCFPKFDKLERRQEEMAEELKHIEVTFSHIPAEVAEIKQDVKDIKKFEINRHRSRAVLIKDILLGLLGSGGIAGAIVLILTLADKL